MVLGGLAPVLGLLQLLLRLPELGQVEGGDLLGVLYLLLVRPRLSLQLLHQLTQLLKVLLVLITCELGKVRYFLKIKESSPVVPL